MMKRVLIVVTVSNFKVLICYSGYDSCLLWTKCSQVYDDDHEDDHKDGADDDDEDANDNDKDVNDENH